MIVHTVVLPSQQGQPHYRYLMSDLHLGSPNCDEGRIVRDLDRARELDARVLINGDVFDAIGPTDKRFDNAVLHPKLHGKKDLTGAIVDLAHDILAPYADLIDVMGIGNHEEAWIKYNHADPVALLIARLNLSNRRAQVKHGSFWGYINTKLEVGGNKAVPWHRLLYYHGTGGDSPVTKGLIDFNRRGRNFQYDCLTFGHKHNKTTSEESLLDVTAAGAIHERHQLNLQTGSYYRNYTQLGDDPLAYSYAASKAHPPKPLGGLFLCLRAYRDGQRWTIRQDYASDFVAPWSAKQGA